MNYRAVLCWSSYSATWATVDFWRLDSGSADTFPAALAEWYRDFLTGWLTILELPISRFTSIRAIRVDDLAAPGRARVFYTDIRGSVLYGKSSDGSACGLRLLKFAGQADDTEGWSAQAWRGFSGFVFEGGQVNPVVGATLQQFAREYMVAQSTGAHDMTPVLPRFDSGGFSRIRAAWFEVAKRSVAAAVVRSRAPRGSAIVL